MEETIIRGNFDDVFCAEVKEAGSNTYVTIPKKYRGKKVKILVYKE